MRSGAPAPLLAMAFNIVLCNLTTTGPTTRTEHLHHHHDWGPHVESSEGGNVSVRVGQTATLDCRVQLLHDKTVSWVRRRPGSEELQLLTVGRQTYSGDERYAVSFQYPDNWRLTVKDSRPADQGDYECQVSTHPPRTVRYNLLIRGFGFWAAGENAGGRRLWKGIKRRQDSRRINSTVCGAAPAGVKGDAELNPTPARPPPASSLCRSNSVWRLFR
ncbi:uncharacterized protein LOC124788475 [Schistocerca piceifrons]|uniref:uncharacterized protein LOC124788475 n=1 Tax=Schistocerca piceifrons TaxID=274613 RepID=UPI001F5F0A37|nr:uncharacterized protein LOC124788475 [Schistocerca piceifrons]